MKLLRQDKAFEKKESKTNKLYTDLIRRKVLKNGLISRSITRVFVYVLLIEISFVFLFPFIYMLVTSTKSFNDLNDITVTWIPTTIEFINYRIAFSALDYLNFFKNSVIVTLISTTGHIIACSFIGYGFARFKFPGKNIIFFMVIFTIMIPVEVLIVPLYRQFSVFGWINTYLPIIVPTFFGFGLKGGLFVFIFRQFYLGLPKELENAAKVDGCNFLRTFFSIIMPTSKPAILVTTILSAVWHWNEHFESTIYINSPGKLLLPARLPGIFNMATAATVDSFVLKAIFGENINITVAVAMAAAFMVILPILVLYLILQKQFIEGVERTGIVE